MPGLEYNKKITNAMSPYQALPDDASLLCNTGSGNITITLPYTGLSNGMELKIVKSSSDANTVTINCKGTDVFMPGSSTSQVLYNQGDFCECESDGTNSNLTTGAWWVEGLYTVATTGIAWIPPSAITASGTATLTRNSQGDWSWNIATGQLVTFLIPLSNLADYVTSANKGAEITSFNISEAIVTAVLPAGHTYTILTTVYTNATANGVSSIANSGVPPTGASGTTLPWLTNVPVGVPAFFNTANESMMLEIAVQTSGGTYRLNGVGVNYNLAASPIGYAE